MKTLVVAALVLVACRDAAPPPPVHTGSADELASYLRTVAGADEATRKREVSAWILDETTWSRDIVEPYRALYNEYVAGFDAQIPAMVAQLAPLGAVTARRHFAGDRKLAAAQIRARWAVPVQFPSMVAEVAGKQIETVFVYDGARWRALLGLDQIVMAHVAALDPACAARLALSGPPGRCTEVGWLVADSALRLQHERFAHACALAATLCGNPGP